MWPHWRRLIEAYGDRLRWRCPLGGMITNWQSFEDPLQAIAKPAQMGPLWLQVRHMTGVAIDGRLWAEDPPHSSIPPCLAAKAAGLQSRDAELHYLEWLWSAAMTEGRNTARRDVLVALAHELAEAQPGLLDPQRFVADLRSEPAIAALRADLQAVRDRGIGRFPTITFRRADRREGRLLVGYRPYEVLQQVLAQILAEAESGTAASSDACQSHALQ